MELSRIGDHQVNVVLDVVVDYQDRLMRKEFVLLSLGWELKASVEIEESGMEVKGK